jgi:aminoglycoside phosphotransferase (APT) family kinase protein
MGSDIADVITVRADEQLDVQAVRDYLHTHVPEATGPLEVQQFGGGHANLTYLLRLGEHEWVLRRPPLGPTLPTAHDMTREYRVLTALAATDVPTPRPIVLCEDPAVIGVPFYIMERRHGFVMRETLPPVIGNDMVKRRRVGAAAIEALAALHAVDWQAVGLGAFGRPSGFVERQLRRWPDQWARAKTRELPTLDAVAAWLYEHVPVSPPTTIVHGDFKLDNLLFDVQDDTLQVTALLDWEMSTLGDPLMDLGWLLSCWCEPDDGAARIAGRPEVTAVPGFMSRTEIVAYYEVCTGRPATAIDFYEVFGLYKYAVILEGIYARYVAGQTRDARFAAFEQDVVHLADAALALSQRAHVT